MIVMFGIFLLTLLVITAVAIVRTPNLFVAVMLMGIASLLIAANFFLLDAADVALTEAAVGAGISTVLFLGALALTSERERSATSRKALSMVVVTAAALVVIYATFDKPHFGSPDAPTQTYVAPWYLEKTREFIDIPNVVTAVLGSFRGYDTLGEVLVVFTAGIGVLFLLSARRGPAGGDDRADGEPAQPDHPRSPSEPGVRADGPHAGRGRGRPGLGGGCHRRGRLAEPPGHHPRLRSPTHSWSARGRGRVRSGPRSRSEVVLRCHRRRRRRRLPRDGALVVRQRLRALRLAAGGVRPRRGERVPGPP